MKETWTLLPDETEVSRMDRIKEIDRKLELIGQAITMLSQREQTFLEKLQETRTVLLERRDDRDKLMIERVELSKRAAA